MNKINFEYSYSSLTLRDVLKIEPTLLDDLTMSTAERTNKFRNMFKAYYNSKSIAGETIELFKLWIGDKFSTYKDYYEDMITEYEKSILLDDGIVTTITHTDIGSNTEEGTNSDTSSRNDSSTNDESGTNTQTGSGTDSTSGTRGVETDDNTDNIDLPNRTTTGEYVSSREKNHIDTDETTSSSTTKSESISGSYSKGNEYSNESSIDNSGEYNKEGSYSKTITETRKGGVNVIEQREKALAYIRNLYLEFVKKFEDCFSCIYG